MESSRSPSARPRTRPPKVRRLKACQRCHIRRIKCDASINGLPCTNCQTANAPDCNFIDSKRLRGPAGRFVATTGQDVDSDQNATARVTTTTTSLPCTPDTLTSPRDSQNTRTVQEVDIALDLTKLQSSRKHNGPVIIHPRENEQSHASDPGDYDSPDLVQKPPPPRYRKWAGFVGESWYASFLLRASNNESSKLRQHIIYGSSTKRTDASYTESHGPGGADGELWRENEPEPLPSDLPAPDVRSGLIDAYFTRFHVLFPITSQAEFQAAILEDRVPIPLLRCILFVGSIHCDAAVIHRMGYSTRADAGDDLFTRAKKCLDDHPEESRCIQMSCYFLLHYWWGRPSTVKDPIWWLSTAIRLAQSLGMHRRIEGSRMSQNSKAHWKRTWWCFYIRDRQVALAMGSPMIINDLECDIEMLTRDDFPDESDATAQYVMAQAKLAKIVSNIYFCHLSPSRTVISTEESQAKVEGEILTVLEQWYGDLPSMLRHGRQWGHMVVLLRIIYNFVKIELIQRVRRTSAFPRSQGPTDLISFASEITRDVEDSQLSWKPERFPMITVTAIFAAMTTQFVATHSADQDRKQLLMQRLRSNLISLRQFEDCYVLARWLRILFEDAMTRQWRSRSASPSDSAEVDFQETFQRRNYEGMIRPPSEIDQHLPGGDESSVFDTDFYFMLPEDDGQSHILADFPWAGNLQDSRGGNFMSDLFY